MPTTHERFLDKTIRDESSGCLIWTGATSNGYPMFKFDGKLSTARRWAWQHANGRQLKDNEFAYMSCERIDCVEAKHMKLKYNKVKFAVPKLPTLKG